MQKYSPFYNDIRPNSSTKNFKKTRQMLELKYGSLIFLPKKLPTTRKIPPIIPENIHQFISNRQRGKSAHSMLSRDYFGNIVEETLGNGSQRLWEYDQNGAVLKYKDFDGPCLNVTSPELFAPGRSVIYDPNSKPSASQRLGEWFNENDIGIRIGNPNFVYLVEQLSNFEVAAISYGLMGRYMTVTPPGESETIPRADSRRRREYRANASGFALDYLN